MALNYMSVDIIGRSSKRSSVAAMAYRAGVVLHEIPSALASAAYRSGKNLQDIEGVITHDYTRKGGVVFSEIMLPNNAPREYMDMETLWNAVERSEKRRDAQTAREVEVGLQREFSLEENIDILRRFITENFVDEGMCANYSVHDKRDGNPHAHILLTMRNVSPEGFLLKNKDWNRKERLLSWRKNWADINNKMFEQKGLDERIDHRSLEAQGIDREPTIHMGKTKTAMERRGIKTERGNINREIMARNEVQSAEKMTENINNLNEDYVKSGFEIRAIGQEVMEDRQKIQRLDSHMEKTEEYAVNVQERQNIVENLQEKLAKQRFWNVLSKIAINKELRQAKRDYQQAREYFEREFHMTVDEAPSEILRIQEQIAAIRLEEMTKNAKIAALSEKMSVVK